MGPQGHHMHPHKGEAKGGILHAEDKEVMWPEGDCGDVATSQGVSTATREARNKASPTAPEAAELGQ